MTASTTSTWAKLRDTPFAGRLPQFFVCVIIIYFISSLLFAAGEILFRAVGEWKVLIPERNTTGEIPGWCTLC